MPLNNNKTTTKQPANLFSAVFFKMGMNTGGAEEQSTKEGSQPAVEI